VLGLGQTAAPQVTTAHGPLWFHCLGDRYGQLLLALLRLERSARPTAQPGLAVQLTEPLTAPPRWTTARVTAVVREQAVWFERLLPLGAYQPLLPPAVREQAVVAHCDIPGFLAVLERLELSPAPPAVASALLACLNEPPAKETATLSSP
jgi:hypothetical protein